MTEKQIEQLAILASQVSTFTPLRLKKPATQCYIPHRIVLEIRAVLDEAKFDWRRLHQEARK